MCNDCFSRPRWPELLLQWAQAVVSVGPDLIWNEPQGFSHIVRQIWAFDPAYVECIPCKNREKQERLGCPVWVSGSVIGSTRWCVAGVFVPSYLRWPRARYDLSLLCAENRAVAADVCRYHSEIVRTALRVTWCCFQLWI